MTTPVPGASEPVPSEPHAPEHAAPHGVLSEIEQVMGRIAADLIAEVRAALTPARLKELAGLCREVAAGSRDAADLVTWLSSHGL